MATEFSPSFALSSSASAIEVQPSSISFLSSDLSYGFPEKRRIDET